MNSLFNFLKIEKKENEFDEHNINKYFKLPIEFTKKINTLDENMKQELNLVNSNDISQNVYNILFKCKSNEGQILLNKLGNNFSYNKLFLKDSQKFYKNLNTKELLELLTNKQTIKSWIDFKNQQEFLKKYQFIEWEQFNKFNQNPIFLQIITLYNLTSPVLQLTLPFIFLLIPFFIIKFSMKIPITLETYKNVLLNQLKGHSLGKVISQLANPDQAEKKITASITIAFYLFSIYQNVLLCYKFYKNIFTIKSFLYNTKLHLENSIKIIDKLELFIKNNNLLSYYEFADELNERKENIENLLSLMKNIKDEKFTITSVHKVGSMMGLFHKLYYKEDIHKLLCFTNGLYGFIDLIDTIQSRVNNKELNKCKIRNKGNTKLTNNKYVFFINNNVNIPNDYNSKYNYIITGPNASGKTTYIKSVLINILLSQQLGYGFYSKAVINPYYKFYSYINIPDTCNRDSLFQSEARRCLNIIKNVDDKKRYLCIFDELFSGTNPEEAVIAGKSFLKYLNNKNIDLLITTHYLGMCDLENENNKKQFLNSHLEVKNTNEGFDYIYKLKSGISKIKGGLKVLEDLEYPEKILNLVKKYSLI